MVAFEEAFQPTSGGVPGYLALLGLNGRAVDAVTLGIARDVMLPDASDRFVTLMTGTGGWREHLVGAVACLVDRDAILDRELLWRAADSESWVTPQLVVTAFLTDPLFAARVRERLGSPVLGASTSTYHAKGTASLVALAALCDDLAPDYARWKADPTIQIAIAVDAARDQSDQIIAEWLPAARALLNRRGAA